MNTVRIVLGCALFVPIGGLAAVWAVVCAVRNDLVSALASFAFAVGCAGLMVSIARVTLGTVKPVVAFKYGGTIFRPDRGIDVPVTAALVGFAIGCSLVAILKPIGRLNIPLPQGQRLSIPFTCGAFAILVSPVIVRTLRRGSSKYLLLTPAGFETAQGWAVRGGSWTDIKNVADAVPERKAATPASIAVELAGGSWVEVAGASFTRDGIALRHLVRHYWQHPEDRPELTDGRAAQRLNDLIDC